MIEVKPLSHCDAVVTIPGSKSYTHRALIISSLADGESILIDALRCEDTEHTAQGLIKFGVPVFWESGRVRVVGKGGKFRATDDGVDVGHSGTSMRFLTALAALRKGISLLDGNERMRKRPVGELLNGLGELGVKAYSQNGDNCPPVIVESQGLEGGKARVKGKESSQFLSGLLMVAPYALRDVHIEVIGPLSSKPYVDITLDVMSAFGVEIQNQGYSSFFVKAGQRYLPQEYRIEGDASSASYFFSASAVCRGRVRVRNLNPSTIQGDIGFLEILERMGCQITRGDDWVEVLGGEFHGIEIDMNEVPDLVPTLAVTAAFAKGKSVIRNIEHLHFKESDRIHALAVELGKMGVHVIEREDGLEIEGGKPHGAEIETHDDHRLAMSFAIAGLAVPEIKIKGERCVGKSFPGFWKTLQELSDK
ncbi:MAG TPA: 3-phosphoshikimate 1-carboxyvinyltransferase [Thermodesulfobacteriota bacterium]|nr:3-phosphoshikimate 1-carboxyvinyltransferase [Thermodesulfobacteriota bacterium]